MPVAVVRTTGGRLFAILDRCLHQGAPLSKGRLGFSSEKSRLIGEYFVEPDETVLRCPWHGYEYDLESGATLAPPCRALRTFAAWENDDYVYVGDVVDEPS